MSSLPVIVNSFLNLEETSSSLNLPFVPSSEFACAIVKSLSSIADKYSIICLDSIDCNIEKNKVLESLKDDGKEIIEISSRQLNSFAGNMIELVYKNQSYLVMSASAYESLSKEQIIKINKYSQIIFSDVSTIEYCGGGSVRCMIAEIFN